MARSATGVVRVAAIPLLIWLFRNRSNHPRRGLRPREGFSSLHPLPGAQEGIFGGGKMARNPISPINPGIYLKEVLQELGLSQYRLAQDIGVPAMRISHVVRGQRPLTAELALRLSRYFRQSPRYWMNLQSRYDMDLAEEALGERVVREVRPFTAVA